MEFNGLLSKLPKPIRVFIGAFVIILSIGYYTGLLFVSETSTASATGIEENYLGNESDENADVMKFKKSERQMLTIIHTHILSMSFIFFLLGILVWLAKLPMKLKLFLTVEPFISVVLTFGGIYLLWSGFLWFKYVVILSGILMTLTFTISALIVLYQLTFNKQYPNNFNQ
ncbi:hypothetical protein [Maribacter hydrothermalis]|uniref:Uncharacterized protein n=1 Tax=Maribacter hydrothermalis TaxID=1836467 RepID=A0A1B7Z1K6_9FLAO|nr:hypothetical protein [Maribacter hydrothermalis]APQ18243.1 hypothetical protein BTR34_13315 [Maribacter hydrothermalis]OBR36589.1 hypothetical protein A9200_09205 [Maribacter hydrothermalis]